jgi:hypothetical protein
MDGQIGRKEGRKEGRKKEGRRKERNRMRILSSGFLTLIKTQTPITQLR